MPPGAVGGCGAPGRWAKPCGPTARGPHGRNSHLAAGRPATNLVPLLPIRSPSRGWGRHALLAVNRARPGQRPSSWRSRQPLTALRPWPSAGSQPTPACVPRCSSWAPRTPHWKWADHRRHTPDPRAARTEAALRPAPAGGARPADPASTRVARVTSPGDRTPRSAAVEGVARGSTRRLPVTSSRRCTPPTACPSLGSAFLPALQSARRARAVRVHQLCHGGGLAIDAALPCTLADANRAAAPPAAPGPPQCERTSTRPDPGPRRVARRHGQDAARRLPATTHPRGDPSGSVFKPRTAGGRPAGAAAGGLSGGSASACRTDGPSQPVRHDVPVDGKDGFTSPGPGWGVRRGRGRAFRVPFRSWALCHRRRRSCTGACHRRRL